MTIMERKARTNTKTMFHSDFFVVRFVELFVVELIVVLFVVLFAVVFHVMTFAVLLTNS